MSTSTSPPSPARETPRRLGTATSPTACSTALRCCDRAKGGAGRRVRRRPRRGAVLGARVRGFRSAVDWPASFFWRELADMYPDAKVVRPPSVPTAPTEPPARSKAAPQGA
ncbi:sulfotransferase [Nonomuraea phyllanthi]|uniref:sulfotransferase n=1 Tax=Nonomuraea phyllanthi TaxID=2219224 RepID=UPI001D02F17E|nr:sulfotransferase [Nonomuraea phyllanthi]